jgi:chromosomal replication initiator protein
MSAPLARVPTSNQSIARMMTVLRSHWDEVCTRVRQHEDPFFHDPWLDRIAFVGSEDDRVVLATPNRLYVDFIQENLEPRLLAHLRSVTEQDWSITYELDATLGPRRALAEAPTAAEAAPAATESPAPEAGHYRIDPRQSFASYIVGSGNQFAAAACQNVAENPAKNYNPLFIFGGVGLGKTHLLNAIGNRMRRDDPGCRVLYLSAEEFTNDMINALRFKRMEEFREKYRTRCDALLVDDIQFLAGRERTQEEFFHTFNALYGSSKQIVVTADRYPKDIDGLEERLRSRFDWGLVADVQPPDTETKVAILRKKADEAELDLPDDVAFFIARSANNNIRELEGTLNRLLAMARFHREPLSIEFARRSLAGYLQVGRPETSIDTIIQGCARFFNIKVSELKGPRRTRQVVVPRQIAMYLARKHTGMSLPEIGKRFGGRDHTTVLHAIRKITGCVEEDAAYRKKVDLVARTLGLNGE